MAWGLRNPTGLAFDPLDDDLLWVTNTGVERRLERQEATHGEELVPLDARPIGNVRDDLFVIDVDKDPPFFGFPDFVHSPRTGDPVPVTDPAVCQPEEVDLVFDCPFLLEEEFREGLEPQPAFAQFEPQATPSAVAVGARQEFGFTGDVFVVLSGSAPAVPGAAPIGGHKLVRVERGSGAVLDLVANRAETPEELFAPETFSRPVDLAFFWDRLFIVDLGGFEPGLGIERPGTGKVWVLLPAEDDDAFEDVTDDADEG